MRALEKGLANLYTTDRSEKTIAGARLSEPRGSLRACITWFGEHQGERTKGGKRRINLVKKVDFDMVRLTKMKKVGVTLDEF